MERGLAASRAEAQSLLLAGRVALTGVGTRTLKPGQAVPIDAELSVDSGPRYASRAAGKLIAALDAFDVEVAGMTCLDAGASTGGFTDVLLERGARRVYAVDVGHGQLIERLRRDPRVVSMEGVNLRALTTLPEPIGLATLDLSFISLRLVLRQVAGVMTDAGRVVCLVKPQFEAGRRDVPRDGVVRDRGVHRAVLMRFGTDAADAGLMPRGVIASPVIGHEGNVEFLVDLRCGAGPEGFEWAVAVDVALADADRGAAQRTG